MDRFFRTLFLVGLIANASVLGQPPPQEPQPQEPPPTEPAPPPPRMVGQVRSPEEGQAWDVVVQAAKTEQVSRAKEFLLQFPDSGMTAHAHYLIAMAAFRQNDFQSFTMHGEEALAELPGALDLKSQLSFYYAEKRQYDDAIRHANDLLLIIQQLRRPPSTPASAWARSRDQLSAAGNYALGRSYLGRYALAEDQKAEGEVLRRAIRHLEQALSFNPADDYAYYRLGDAYLARSEADQAMVAYSRAAAVSGSISAHARARLESLYEEMNKSKDEADRVIVREQEYLRQQVAEKESAYQSLDTPQPPPDEPR